MAKSTIYSSALLLFAALGSTLEVAPDSPCAQKCLDDPEHGNATMREASSTNTTMLACYDQDFVGDSSSAVGRKFTDCNACLQKSGYQDSLGWNERDTTWFMLNNRAALDWCIFGAFEKFETNDQVNDTYVYQECNSQCSTISESIDYFIISDSRDYAFCDITGNLTSDAEACTTCLYETPDLTILGNILAAVKELCVQKPGQKFKFEADIYAATRIAQTSTSTTSPSLPPQTTSASAALPPSSNTASKDFSLSKGALAGIVLGALFLLILVLGAILLVLRRIKKKKNAAVVKSKEGAYELNSPLSNYHELPAVHQPKYSHQSRPAELSEQGVIAELASTSNSARYSPFMDHDRERRT